jgi:hypothetical protein
MVKSRHGLLVGALLAALLLVIACILWPSANLMAPHTPPEPTGATPEAVTRVLVPPSGDASSSSDPPLRISAGGMVIVRVTGIDASLSVPIACYQDEPRRLLWSGSATVLEPLVRDVPAETKVMLVTRSTANSDERLAEVSVSAGEAREVAFDFGQLVECRFHIMDWAISGLEGNAVTLTFLDSGGNQVGGFALTTPNNQGDFVVSGKIGTLVACHMGTTPLVGEAVESIDFDLRMGPHNLKLKERFAVLRRLGDSQPPLFAHIAGNIRPFVTGRLVVAESSITDDVVVFDLAARYCVLPRAGIVYDAPNWVSLNESNLFATIAVDRDARSSNALVLFGPEPEGRPAHLLRASDPRRMEAACRDGTCRFGPLVPGFYSLRWLEDGRTTPVIAQIRVTSEGGQIDLRGRRPRLVHLRIEGWESIADHLGVTSCRIRIDGQRYVLSQSGEAMVYLQRDPAMLRLETDHASARFGLVPLRILERSTESLVAAAEERLSCYSLRVSNIFGGDVVLVSEDGTRLSARADGSFGLCGTEGERMRGTTIEFFDRRKYVIGYVDCSVPATGRTIDVAVQGRWVDISVPSASGSGNLRINRVGYSSEVVGRVGRDGTCRLWVPNSEVSVILERDGRDLAAAIVPLGAVSCDLEVK